LCIGSKIGDKVKSWFSSNLGGELAEMHRNELSKVWLQKELILVGFLLSQVLTLCLVFVPWYQIGEKMKSWFLSNLGGEMS